MIYVRILLLLLLLLLFNLCSDILSSKADRTISAAEKWSGLSIFPPTSVSEETDTKGAAGEEKKGSYRLTGRTGCRVQTKYNLNVTTATRRRDKKQSSGGDGGISTERTDKIPSGGAQVTLSHSRIFLFVIYIWGSGCPLVSSRRHESQPCLPPWRLMKLPWVLLTAAIHFKEPNKQKEKYRWRLPAPVCVYVCVGELLCLQVWVGVTGMRVETWM